LSLGNALAEETKALAKGSSLLLPFSLGDAFAEEAKALAEGNSLLLAGTGGVLVEELLAAGSLFVAGASGMLFEELLAVGCLVPLVSLIGNGLSLRGSRLSMLLHRLQCTRAAFLLVLHAGKCDLTLQLPRGLASKLGKEASATEPQEDDSGGRRLPCLSDASATSRLLVKEALVTCSPPLTFEGGTLVVKKTLSCASGLPTGGHLLLACKNSVLVEEPLVVGNLFLAGASGLLDEECLVLVRPQIADGRLPIHVGAVRASASPMKNGPSGCPRRQQSGSLLVFANGSLMPFLVAKRSTNIGQGAVAFVVVKQPLRGAWGRLRPFKLQPPGRIGEVGGQRSRR